MLAMRRGVLCLLPEKRVGLRCDLRVFIELVLRLAHGAHDVALERHRDEGERIAEQAEVRILRLPHEGHRVIEFPGNLPNHQVRHRCYLPSAGLDSSIDGVTHADADTGV